MKETKIICYQGADITCEFEILQPSGLPVDFSELGVKVYVFLKDGYNNIVDKFKSGAAASGYKILDNTEFDDGIIRFQVLSDTTEELEPGKYFIELLARFQDANATDDSYFDLQLESYAFNIKKSVIPPLTLP